MSECDLKAQAAFEEYSHDRSIEELQKKLVDANQHVTELEGRLRVLWDKLEKERKHYQEHIKRLEEELMESKNKYSALVADVVHYEDMLDRIKRLEAAGDELAGKHLFAVHTYDNAKKHVAEWYKAKEAKP